MVQHKKWGAIAAVSQKVNTTIRREEEDEEVIAFSVTPFYVSTPLLINSHAAARVVTVHSGGEA